MTLYYKITNNVLIELRNYNIELSGKNISFENRIGKESIYRKFETPEAARKEFDSLTTLLCTPGTRCYKPEQASMPVWEATKAKSTAFEYLAILMIVTMLASGLLYLTVQVVSEVKRVGVSNAITAPGNR